MILSVTVTSAYSSWFNAANAFGIAVIADAVVIFVNIFAAVGAVIALVSAAVAQTVVIAVTEGAIHRAAIRDNRAASVTSVMSAVSGDNYTCHCHCRNGSQNYG